MYFLNLKDKILGKIYIKQKDVYFKYSTDEQWTGEYWINGAKIYCKVIAIDGFNSDKHINHGISNFDMVLSADVFMKYNDYNCMIPRAHKDNVHDGIAIVVNKTQLILEVGPVNDFSSMSGYAILKYIKTTKKKETKYG